MFSRVLVSALFFGSTLASPAEAATNVLVILLDDIGVDKITSYQSDVTGYAPTMMPQTPNIDSLAAAGVRFSTAWAQPSCSPTRASLQTGRYPFRTGIGYPLPHSPDLAESETTLAEALASTAGGRTAYATGLFGKWHLGELGADGTNSWTAPASGTATIGDTVNPMRHGYTAFDGALDGEIESYWSWTRVWSSTSGTASVAMEDGFATTEITTAAASWIGAQTGPWLAVVTLHAPHTDESSGGYDSRHLTEGCSPSSSASTTNSRLSVYRALTECADASIASLLNAIPATTLQQTLIAVAGDNGTDTAVLESVFTSVGTTHTANGKGTLYESGIRVPLVIASGANWLERQACLAAGTSTCTYTSGLVTTPGRVVSAPVVITDLFSTFADYGATSYATATDGASLRSCLEARTTCSTTAVGSRTTVYAEQFKCTETSGVAGCNASWSNLNTATAALRKSGYKLITSYSGTEGCVRYQLYNLAKDRFETKDVVTSSASKKTELVTAMTTLAPNWYTGKTECSS